MLQVATHRIGFPSYFIYLVVVRQTDFNFEYR